MSSRSSVVAYGKISFFIKAQFSLYEASEIVKLIETESRKVVARAGEGERAVAVQWYKVSAIRDECTSYRSAVQHRACREVKNLLCT